MVYVCLQSDLLYAVVLKRRSSVTDVCQLLSGSWCNTAVYNTDLAARPQDKLFHSKSPTTVYYDIQVFCTIWVRLLHTCKNRRPYNLYCVGADVKPCSITFMPVHSIAPPICIPCNSLLTVERILISCIDFDIIRQNFYTASNLFHNIHPKHIISSIHAIGLTNKL